MNQSFGARLRLRREEQSIALVEVAERTKIKLSLLEGLERDDVSHWPSGIFRRAFVRAYADAIRLNPDVIVREFLEVHPDPADPVLAEPEAGAEAARTAQGPQTRLRHIVGSTIESLSRFRRVPAGQTPVVAPARADVTPQPEAELPAAPPAVEPRRLDTPAAAIAAGPPVHEAEPAPDPDFLAVAHLCTEFGRVENTNEMQPLLPEAARILHATGLIVWIWDGLSAALRPALAHGYSNAVLAQLPAVDRDANNATAAAFRSSELCVINGTDRSSGALVVPLLTPAGCAGVLAIELQRGRQHTSSARAVATILAAQLAQLVAGVSTEVQSRAAV